MTALYTPRARGFAPMRATYAGGPLTFTAFTRLELAAAHDDAADILADALEEARALAAELEHETAAYMRARLGIDPDGVPLWTEADILAAAAAHLSAGTDLGVRLAVATLRGYLDRPGVAALYAPIDLDAVVALARQFTTAVSRVSTALAAGFSAFGTAWRAAMAYELQEERRRFSGATTDAYSLAPPPHGSAPNRTTHPTQED